ncbi:DUF5590 domain-containing protein [Aciduricibacillus chroicocephali]|uniref:DUF5590 domain-containing protein n=1 Tax=Aciduricibacillus chroicocephali TaxID=3054939 RepID=A0ABY9KZ36_9BACI|nr:DUF5590 domain-containing protein [Bacillaceae bacterium 44XB]
MRRNSLTWGKLIVFAIAVLLVATCIAAALIYNQVLNDKTKGFAAAEKTAIRKAGLSEVIQVDRFDSKKSYYIVQGKDKKGKGKFVFIPMAKKEKPAIIDDKDIYAEGKVKEIWRESCSSCTFVKTSAAMIANEPLWEITYKDGSGHYGFAYFSMKDGTATEQFRLSNTIR